MPQLVTEIILVEKDYGLAHGENRVQAVVEYVNGLLARYFDLEELPPTAVQCYYVDYYMHQVLNGDIHQFVYNSRWNPMIVDSVSTALDTLDVPDQRALFREAREYIERDQARLEAFLAGEYDSPATRPYMTDLENVGGHFFKRFIAHPDGARAGQRQIAVANAAWVATWPDARWVAAAAFEKELDRLAAVIPDLPARRRSAEQSQPWQFKRIDEVMTTAGHRLLRLIGVDGGEWHLATDRGQHRVKFANREAMLLRGDGDDVIARVPAPEAE